MSKIDTGTTGIAVSEMLNRREDMRRRLVARVKIMSGMQTYASDYGK